MTDAVGASAIWTSASLLLAARAAPLACAAGALKLVEVQQTDDPSRTKGTRHEDHVRRLSARAGPGRMQSLAGPRNRSCSKDL